MVPRTSEGPSCRYGSLTCGEARCVRFPAISVHITNDLSSSPAVRGSQSLVLITGSRSAVATVLQAQQRE